LQNLDYTVEVIPGVNNDIADYLSRMNDIDRDITKWCVKDTSDTDYTQNN